MKTAYAELAAARADHELARTFFNSATRRVFATVGIDPEIEFVEAMPVGLEDEGPPPYTSHAHGGATAALIRDILATIRSAPRTAASTTTPTSSPGGSTPIARRRGASRPSTRSRCWTPCSIATRAPTWSGASAAAGG
jgi:hypothetical protein